MGSFDWILELALLGLLGGTMVHAIRLERALRTLRSDRTALGEAISGFDTSTRQAEAGLGRLQATANESAVAISQKLEAAGPLIQDLRFLIERGEAVADRLDTSVRATRALPAATPATPPEPAAKSRSQAERELLLALRSAQ